MKNIIFINECWYELLLNEHRSIILEWIEEPYTMLCHLIRSYSIPFIELNYIRYAILKWHME